MMVTLIGIGSETLLGDCDAAGVKYARRRPQPGTVTTGGQVLEVLGSSVPAIAGIIVAWLNARPSRILTVTRKDGTTWHARGKSIAEVEKLLTGAKEMMALETEKTDTAEK